MKPAAIFIIYFILIFQTNCTIKACTNPGINDAEEYYFISDTSLIKTESLSMDRIAQLLQGKWASKGHNNFTIEVKGNSWKVIHNSRAFSQDKDYEFVLSKNLPKMILEVPDSRFISLKSKLDTLYYQIAGISESTLYLIQIPGNEIIILKQIKY